MKKVKTNIERVNGVMNAMLRRMTSLEVAEVTGKKHCDVMRAIRNMEPAWVNVCGRKFALTSRTVVQPNGGKRKEPCYELTKTECLYIATKFNDEARARLVLRWQELELQARDEEQMREMMDVEILSRAVLISGKEIKRLEAVCEALVPRAMYCDEVLESVSCMTTTQIAKELGMSGNELNRQLCERGVQYRQSGQYMLYADLARRGYSQNRTHSFRDDDGEVHTRSYLVWTEAGREFIHRLFGREYKKSVVPYNSETSINYL